MIKTLKRGFSLLETLVATGVLLIVTLAIVSLSNSLIAGTVVNADKTIINRWAAEGVELTQKVRDDTVLNKATAPGWFTPALADNGHDYGWYKLSTADNKVWTLSRVSSGNIDAATFKQFAETLTSDQTTGYRLICVEAVAASAVASNGDATFHCNTQGQSAVEDGARTPVADCPNTTPDLYCYMTRPSLNKNQLGNDKFIPAGSAVKVRSVVIWDERDQIHTSSIATLLTNWKGYEQ